MEHRAVKNLRDFEGKDQCVRKVALATLKIQNQITEAALCQWLEDTALLQGDQPYRCL